MKSVLGLESRISIRSWMGLKVKLRLTGTSLFKGDVATCGGPARRRDLSGHFKPDQC